MRVGRVVDVDFPGAFPVWQGTLVDERLEEAADFGDFADQIPTQVERMRADVAQRARACARLFEPPYARKLWIDDPILQVAAAKMMDGADAALGDDLFGQTDGGA